jgi:hypothetical protein
MVMIGSTAAHETHALSDRDIEIYATDPAPLLADDSWWDQLGDVLVVERLAIPGWHPARLVYYIVGKLDLTVIRSDVLQTICYERPFTVLVDQNDLSDLLHVTVAGTSLPDEAAFRERLNWGYAAALMCAKAVVRDERWSGKIRDLKASLLTFIEWDHHVRHGIDYDVRFLAPACGNGWPPTCSKLLNSAGGISTLRTLRRPCALRSPCSPGLAGVSRTALVSGPSTTTASTARSKPFSQCIRMAPNESRASQLHAAANLSRWTILYRTRMRHHSTFAVGTHPVHRAVECAALATRTAKPCNSCRGFAGPLKSFLLEQLSGKNGASASRRAGSH